MIPHIDISPWALEKRGLAGKGSQRGALLFRAGDKPPPTSSVAV
jgi:hypothetical protein